MENAEVFKKINFNDGSVKNATTESVGKCYGIFQPRTKYRISCNDIEQIERNTSSHDISD